MTDKTPSRINNQLLIDWSKWLISINFLSGTGCVIALKTAPAVSPMVGAFFFGALLSFALSVLVSTLFVFLLAKRGDAEQTAPLPFLGMAVIQWCLFAIGLICVLMWIGRLAKIW